MPRGQASKAAKKERKRAQRKQAPKLTAPPRQTELLRIPAEAALTPADLYATPLGLTADLNENMCIDLGQSGPGPCVYLRAILLAQQGYPVVLAELIDQYAREPIESNISIRAHAVNYLTYTSGMGGFGPWGYGFC